MLRHWISIVALFLVLTIPQSTGAQVTEPLEIETGLITGVTLDGVDVFKGIPYATPPVGALRWRAPQPAVAWSGIRAADRFGDICVQPSRPSGAGNTETPENMSEDCLTLNVFRPTSVTRPLPAMVWIHGGGFTRGSSAALRVGFESHAARANLRTRSMTEAA